MKKTTLMTHLLPALAIVVLGSTVSIPQTVSAQSVTDEDAEPQLAVAKIRGTDQTRIYEVVDGMAITEGDIVLGTHEEVQANGILPLAVNPPPTGPQPQQRGAIVADPDKRWPNGVVPYTLADGSSNGTINSVEAGIAEWEAKTSIRFVPRTNQSDYVE